MLNLFSLGFTYSIFWDNITIFKIMMKNVIIRYLLCIRITFFQFYFVFLKLLQ